MENSVFDPTGQGNLPLSGQKPARIVPNAIQVVFEPRELWEKEGGGMLKAISGDRELGYLEFHNWHSYGGLSATEAVIDFIRVEPQFRGWGIGQRLYLALRDYLRQNHPSVIKISGQVHTSEALNSRVQALGKPSKLRGISDEYPLTQIGVQQAAQAMPPMYEDGDGELQTHSDFAYMEHPVKRRMNFPKDQAAEQAVALAQIADAEGNVRAADALDNALVRVAQAQGQVSAAQQISHLYNIINQLNRHYSTQFQIIARQLRQLHGGGHMSNQDQESGGGVLPKPKNDSNFPQMNIAPGAQVSLDAQNAEAVTVNTV